MKDIAELLFKPLVVIFLATTLMDMGLRLNVPSALKGMKNARFMAYTVLWGFVLAPALSFLITLMLPLEQGYANGLILVGLAPCAPFLPILVDRAKGDLGLTAAFMMVSLVLTIIILPFVLPVLASGMTVTAWALFKPLLISMVIPLIIGMMILRRSEAAAARILPYVKKITGISAILLIVDLIILYGGGIINSAGSMGLLSQVMLFMILCTLPYLLAFGLKKDVKTVLVIGSTSRNIGAAIAPCVAIADMDPKTTVMVVMSLLVMTLFSLLAARFWGPKEPKVPKAGKGEKLFR